jgi:hypothetical protein
MDIFLPEVTGVLPLLFGTLAVLLDRERNSTGSRSCNYSAAGVNEANRIRRRTGFYLMAPGRNR